VGIVILGLCALYLASRIALRIVRVAIRLFSREEFKSKPIRYPQEGRNARGDGLLGAVISLCATIVIGTVTIAIGTILSALRAAAFLLNAPIKYVAQPLSQYLHGAIEPLLRRMAGAPDLDTNDLIAALSGLISEDPAQFEWIATRANVLWLMPALVNTRKASVDVILRALGIIQAADVEAARRECVFRWLCGVGVIPDDPSMRSPEPSAQRVTSAYLGGYGNGQDPSPNKHAES
jgi:hypothetical protein